MRKISSHLHKNPSNLGKFCLGNVQPAIRAAQATRALNRSRGCTVRAALVLGCAGAVCVRAGIETRGWSVEQHARWVFSTGVAQQARNGEGCSGRRGRRCHGGADSLFASWFASSLTWHCKRKRSPHHCRMQFALVMIVIDVTESDVHVVPGTQRPESCLRL